MTVCRKEWVALCKRQQRTKLVWCGFLQGFVVAADGFSPLASSDCFLSGPTNASFSKCFECWMKDSSAWGK